MLYKYFRIATKRNGKNRLVFQFLGRLRVRSRRRTLALRQYQPRQRFLLIVKRILQVIRDRVRSLPMKRSRYFSTLLGF